MTTKTVIYNTYTPHSNIRYEVFMEPNFSGIRWRLHSIESNKIVDQSCGAFYDNDAVEKAMSACVKHWGKFLEFGKTYDLTEFLSP